MRRMILAGSAIVALMLGLVVSPALAATKATAISDGTRIVVTISGKKPSKVSLVVAGTAYKLTRSGTTWRTKALSTQQLSALVGQPARIKAKGKGKSRTVKTTVTGTGTAPITPGGGAEPLFAAPGVERTGQDAWNAISAYATNFTMTDCPAGWPACAVETRYGFFDNGSVAYCRLQNASGSDIKSYVSVRQIIGVSQHADGSWAVSFLADSYGSVTTYTVSMAANGIGEVWYWGPGVDAASNQPTSIDTGLQWMRGAKDCSY